MPKTLRIAVWYNLPSGGAKRALHGQVKGLVQRGHQVEIWRPPEFDADYLPLAGLAREHEVPLEDHLMDSWFYPKKLSLFIHHPDRQIEAIRKHSQACAEEIRPGGFDVLFANTDVVMAAPFIGRYVDLPKLLYIQDPNRNLYEPMPRLPWILPPEHEYSGWGPRQLKRRGRYHTYLREAALFAREELENAKAFDKILVNSLYSRESILRSYGLDSSVCYLGVDTGVFRPSGVGREPFVIGVGTMAPSKNVKFVIEAIGKIPGQVRPKLVWVANMKAADYLAACIEMAKALGVEFQPKIMITDEELVDLLNRATAFVYAPRLEPFGLAPLEANACGTPVVAVAEGGVRETIMHGVNGLLSLPEPEEFARHVQRLMSDAALWKSLSSAALIGVQERWSITAANDRLEAHLLQVAAKSV